MEFGLAFDDDIFESSRDRSCGDKLVSYNAKRCPKEWFLESLATEDPQQRLQVYKFKADWAFNNKDYSTAIAFYKSALEILPANNTAMRRDIEESLSRSFMGNKEFDKSLPLAIKLDNESQNFDQKTDTLNLLVSVYRGLNKIVEEVITLQKAIFLHPYNPPLWIKLADAYALMLESCSKVLGCKKIDHIEGQPLETLESNLKDTFLLQNSCDASSKQKTKPDKILNSNKSDDTKFDEIHEGNVGDKLHQMEEKPVHSRSKYEQGDSATQLSPDNFHGHAVICVCLLRARLLLRNMRNSVVSFVKEKNCIVEKQISQRIEDLNLPRACIKEYEEFLREDLHDNKDEKIDMSQVEQVTFISDNSPLRFKQVFEAKWFGHIKIQEK